MTASCTPPNHYLTPLSQPQTNLPSHISTQPPLPPSQTNFPFHHSSTTFLAYTSFPQPLTMKKKQNQITFGFCDVNTGQRVYPALTDLPDKLPPAQQLYTSDDNMYAAITCSPPIGQSTAIPKNQTSVSTPQTIHRALSC